MKLLLVGVQELTHRRWSPGRRARDSLKAAALALPVLIPHLAHADCVGLGCDGPVREAYIICCNQLGEGGDYRYWMR